MFCHVVQYRGLRSDVWWFWKYQNMIISIIGTFFDLQWEIWLLGRNRLCTGTSGQSLVLGHQRGSYEAELQVEYLAYWACVMLYHRINQIIKYLN